MNIARLFYLLSFDSVAEVINRVMEKTDPPFRPSLEGLDCPAALINLMEQCWAQEPTMRPGLTEIIRVIREIGGTG